MESAVEKRWVLPVLVAAGGLCVFFIGSRLGSPASAQVELPFSSDGRILVVPVQTGRDSYGLAMVDTVGQTLWVYELNSRGPAYNRLRLLAARSWRYDRQLQQYNTTEPKPEQVKMLLENLGHLQKEQSRQERPGSRDSILEVAEPEGTDAGHGR